MNSVTLLGGGDAASIIADRRLESSSLMLDGEPQTVYERGLQIVAKKCGVSGTAGKRRD